MILQEHKKEGRFQWIVYGFARERVLNACQTENLPYAELADRFGIGRATVTRWKRLYRETGSMTPRPHRGRRQRAIHTEKESMVEALVLMYPDWTEEEYREELAKNGIKASRATVGRIIRSLHSVNANVIVSF